ncbi:hypothetical protein PHLGIDRAFT_457821 [Phlebiopsis gigantea 11061_1 CR5-6]|uniref:Uncharacterized protein n=1 Tax=Phlebiopsis gigantea (strain 11061_1 CR5-6) TaxID=745531 RepID=A0A0C3SF79_PHLG1|nr:hypothetical protein PHLGIDRAFT_457821 [Phlebiopsis gigantea 11061_1 CR5-6]
MPSTSTRADLSHRLPFPAHPKSTRLLSEPILYLPPVHISVPSHSAETYRIDARGVYSPLRCPAANDVQASTIALHKALHQFRPVTDEHAQMPYAEVFNWGELLLPLDMEHEWYAVACHSTCENGDLGGPSYDLDEKTHSEALRSGGLILYWRGISNPATGTNLTTCIWQSRAHAITANSGPHHIRALRQAVTSCEKFELHRYRLRKLSGERALRVEAYDRGDDGW